MNNALDYACPKHPDDRHHSVNHYDGRYHVGVMCMKCRKTYWITPDGLAVKYAPERKKEDRTP